MLKSIGKEMSFRSIMSQVLIFTLLIVTCVISNPQNVYAATNYYVDGTNGNDNNTGTSLGAPFKTIKKAASVVQAGGIVYICGGVYRENYYNGQTNNDPIVPAYSGTSGNPITFMPYNNESVTITGCDPLSGWTQDNGNANVYYTTMNWDLADKNQIFVNDEMMNEARWPNQAGTLVNPTFATADSGTDATHIVDSELPGDSNDVYNGATMHIISGVSFLMITSNVTDYVAATKTLTIDPLFCPYPTYGPIPGASYYISGLKVLLDAQKEWFYDSSTSRLYIYVPGGGSPADKTVEAKRRMTAIDLSNRSYINILDITIKASTIVMNDSTNHCSLDGLTCEYLSHSDLSDANWEYQQKDLGILIKGSYNEIRNSEIAYSSSGLISISGSYNNVINCYIHDGQYVPIMAASMIYLNSKYSLISNNTVCDSGRGLIGWGSNMHACKIQYNKIYNGAWQTADIGSIYGANCEGGNTEIAYNEVGDSKAVNAMGIYTDNFSSNFIIHHNVLYNNTGLQMNSPGNFIIMYNNTAWDQCWGLVTWAETQELYDLTGSKVYNNILKGIEDRVKAYASCGNNIMSSPAFVDEYNHDFRLQSNSPAINAGTATSGITNGYAGSAPDCGAYEYGGTDWTAGHNFADPPNPAYSTANVEYMNLMGGLNAGFEVDPNNIPSWTKTGAMLGTAIYFDRWSNSNMSTGESRTNFYGLRLGGASAIDGVEQTITGLSPYTKYALTGWMRSPNGEIATLGVKDYGGSELTAFSTSNTWKKETIQFTTGNNTSATIYFSKSSAGTNYIYCDDIGLQKVKETTFFDSFENGFGNWVTANGTPTTSTTQHKSGSYSYVQDEATDSIIHYTNENLNKYAVVWFYDDASDTSVSTAAFVDNNSSTPIGIGVDTSLDTTHYWYKVGSGTLNEYATTITRTTGWHQFAFDYTSGTDVKLYLDGILIATSSVCRSFNRIALGDCWGTGSTVYYDDVGIYDEMPPLFLDSFENGFGNWVRANGTPTTSTTQHKSGSCSYVQDEATDSIIHYTNGNLNKYAVVWFYDDALDVSVSTAAFVDNNSSTPIGIGVDTSLDTTHYWYKVGSGIGNEHATAITRTTGWHKFAFDYTSGTDVKLYLDGILIATSSVCTSFNRIALGDCWGTGSTTYYDDIGIYETPSLFFDSFENGFGNWVTANGTPTTSTTQKMSGGCSYVQNEATDSIIHYTNENLNKYVAVWFYDDASDTSVSTAAFVDNGSTPIGIGIDTSLNSTHYWFKTGSGTENEHATIITRTTGWHQFVFDYSSGTDVKLYLDGMLIATSILCKSFNRIQLGDCWGSGGTFYYDDVSIGEIVSF